MGAGLSSGPGLGARTAVDGSVVDRLQTRDPDPAALAGDVASVGTLCGAGRPDDAWNLFTERLDGPTRRGLRASALRGPLLEHLAGAGVPALSDARARADVLHELALVTNLVGGRPGRAIRSYALLVELCDEQGDEGRLSAVLGNYAKSLRQAGHFRVSETVARQGLAVQRRRGERVQEAVNLYWVGMGLAHRGVATDSDVALQRALRIFAVHAQPQAQGATHAFLAQRALWLGDAAAALPEADRAWRIGLEMEHRGDADLFGAVKVLSAAARMQGEAHLQAGHLDAAQERLRVALELAALIDFVEETLPALRASALLALARGDSAGARTHLEATWPLAQRGPYPLYDADSFLILAAVERAAGDPAAAVAAAERAYLLAWCDGPPFAYQRGLDEASLLLSELGATLPDVLVRELASTAEPPPDLPAVELDPDDDYGRSRR